MFSGLATDQQGHAHVFFGGKFRQQVVLLPNVADLAVAERRQIRFGQTGDVALFVIDGTAAWFIEAADQVQERTLPRPAFTDDRDLFTRCDIKHQLAENDQFGITGTVDLGEFVQTNEGSKLQATV